MVVLALRGAEDLAGSVASRLGEEVVVAEEREFPDGEVLVRAEASGPVTVVARLWPDPNKALMRLLLALDAVSDSATRITVVAPYLPYARQDRRFRPGEPISIRAVLRMFSAYPVTRLVAVDVHKPYVAEYAGRTTLVNVSPMGEAASHVKALGLEKPLVLSPDIGSAGRAEDLARRLGTDHAYLVKHRDRVTGKVKTEVPGGVSMSGRDVVIVDDILATGGTMVEACRIARELGARRVYAYATHCQLIGDAERRLSQCLDGLMCSNTIPCRYSAIDVSGPIVEALA